MERPSSPDPFMGSMMQGQLNWQAAKQQQQMNMVNQDTPYGSLNYVEDKNSPGGYRAVQQLTPELQKLLGSNTRMAQGASDIGGALLGNAADRLSKPLDLSYSNTEARLNELNRKTLDPLWQQRQNDFDQSMANKGIAPGSEAYTNASRSFGMQRDGAYNDMLLRGHQTAVSDLMNEYNSPLNAIGQLRGASSVQQPVGSIGFTQTPQQSIQPVDLMGALQDKYKNDMSNYQGTMGGLFGLGGSLIGLGGKMFGF